MHTLEYSITSPRCIDT